MLIKHIYSARARWVFTFLVLLTFAYGVVMFPDAPINLCEQGYCGKYGNPHSETDYRHFVIWGYVILSVFVIAVIYSISWSLLKRKEEISKFDI